MYILQDYKRSLRDIALADEIMRTGIPEDVQAAVEMKQRAIADRDAYEQVIEDALKHFKGIVAEEEDWHEPV